LGLRERSEVRQRQAVLYFAPAGRPVPDLLAHWAETRAFAVVPLAERAAVEMTAARSLPALVVIAEQLGDEGRLLSERLKADPYTGIIPVAVFAGEHTSDHTRAWFAAGADEVITPLFEPAEQRARLDALLTRAETSVSVHPSTRLAGTTEIEREIRRRLEAGERFAVCYADLDHFKEFNDRYSYYDGDRVIYLLSRMLRDVVKGMCPERSFVGHIGGDDFIFIVPTDRVNEICAEVIGVFDALIPFQYSDQDRRAGYFFGKDRRGQLYRVPLMTLSIGIVTNERRHFTHPAQVSGLATEMKSYAKTLPGSVFVVDRRHDAPDET
jgi:GGDEF domain-containing protein